MIQNSMLSSQNVTVKNQLGCMQVVEYAKDMSVHMLTARTEFFCSQMNVQRRQLLVDLNGNSVTVQAGAMQWTAGNVEMSSGIKGAGDFLGKMVTSKMTGESAAKPVYTGSGQLMLEPTYRHIILMDVGSWGGSVVLDDGLFLACDSTLQQKVVARNNLSSAVLGGEGLFNLSLNGQGIAALESVVPMEELIEVVLDNDTMKIDGNMAIAWSSSLQFTVEKSSRSLLGSAVSGEGLVNVYRGTGKIWMAPVIRGFGSAGMANPTENAEVAPTGSSSSKVLNKIDKLSGLLDIIS
ncbi:MAG: AIM24 family protein [Lachnospiraceae bacterium]|nr:AIM24 family protein [Lachnospiraceae bacterium]